MAGTVSKMPLDDDNITIIDPLSDDVLLLIFDKLDLNDKARVRRVCSNWRFIVDSQLIKVKVVSTELPQNEYQRWSHCCHMSASSSNRVPGHFKSLSEIAVIVKACPNVVGLNLHGAVLTASGLTKLASTAAWSKLQHIEICYCKIGKNEDEEEVKLELISNIRKCVFLRHFAFYKTKDEWTGEIIDRCAKKLNIFTIGFNGYSGKLPLQHVGRDVKRLEVHGVGLASADLENLIQRAPGANCNIEQLTFKNARLSPRTLQQVTPHFPNLKTLELPLPMITSTGQVIKAFSRLKKLERIGLFHRHLYEEVNIDNLIFRLTGLYGSQLKALSIGLYPISNKAIFAIANNCPNLEVLEVGKTDVYNFSPVLNPTADYISGISNKCSSAFRVLKQLQTINLSLTRIDDEGIIDIVSFCKKLRRLELNCCKQITQHGILSFVSLARSKPSETFVLSVRNVDNFEYGVSIALPKNLTVIVY